MSKLKGKTKLNKAISAELKPFGISKAELSDEYSYCFEDESIAFKITENGMEDIFFNDFIKERFDYVCAFPFVLSLLHEVGHTLGWNHTVDGLMKSTADRSNDSIYLSSISEICGGG